MFAAAVDADTVFVDVDHQAGVNTVDISNVTAKRDRVLKVGEVECCSRSCGNRDQVRRLAYGNNFLNGRFSLQINRQVVDVANVDRCNIDGLDAVDRDAVRAARQ